MTEGRLAPEEVRTRTFTRVVRGYRPRQVRRLLERAAKDLVRLRDGSAATAPDDPPPLTAREIEEARFQPAIGGYEMDEVDQFLDQLMVELDRVAQDPLHPSALPAPPRHAAFPTITPGPQRADFPRPAGAAGPAAESFGRLEDRPTGQWMGPLSPPPTPAPPVGAPPPQPSERVPPPHRPEGVPPPHRTGGVAHPPAPEGGAPAWEGSPTAGTEPRVVHSPPAAAPGAGGGAGPEAGAGEGPTAQAAVGAAQARAAEPEVGTGPAGTAGPEPDAGEEPADGAGAPPQVPRSAGPLPTAQPRPAAGSPAPPQPAPPPAGAGPGGPPPPPRRAPTTSEEEGYFPPPTMPPSAAPPTPPPPPPTTQRPAAGADEGLFPPPSVPPSAAPQAPPPRPAAPLAAQAPSTGRPLTPAEVETRNFDRGAPGYLPNHVDLFLARAARAMAGRDGETMTRWDVLRQRFPLGPRGYATAEVDAFLVRLAAQFPDPDPATQEEILRKLEGGG
jgi:DivIVA domain-containing protein